MKYMGVDYGKKRIGIAFSDHDGKIAFPYQVIQNSKFLIKDILELVEKNEIGAIVVGESNNLDGTPNNLMEDINKFIEKIEEKSNIEVVLHPEFLTSHQAHKQNINKNDTIDAIAASILLQSYLDQHNNV